MVDFTATPFASTNFIAQTDPVAPAPERDAGAKAAARRQLGLPGTRDELEALIKKIAACGR